MGLLATRRSDSSSAALTKDSNLSVSSDGGNWTSIRTVQTTTLDGGAMLAPSLSAKAVMWGQSGPAVQTQTTIYDTPALGQAPLLQVMKTYAQIGNWQHGFTFTYDGDGRLASRSLYDSPDGGKAVSLEPKVESYTYDPATGALTSATTHFAAGPSGLDAGTLTRSWSAFDPAGRPSQAVDPVGVMRTTSYDLLGRLTHAARWGQGAWEVSWSGDNANRTVQTSSGTRTDRFDGFGRLVESMNPSGQIMRLTYDAEGRKVALKEIAGNGSASAARLTEWSYDPLGRVTSETSPDGVTTAITYSLSGLNTVRTAINSATRLKVAEATDPFGQVVSTIVSDWRNGAYVVVKASSFTYDGLGHLTKAIETDPGGVSQTRTFTYNADGHLVSKTEPETGTQTFSAFNALGQPTIVGDGVRSRTLSYDGLGRLLSATSSGESLSYTYTGAQLTGAATVSSGQTITQSFAYLPPASGAMLASETTQSPDFSASLGYAYDPDGRLRTLTYPSGRLVTYGYDTLGRVQTVSQTAPSGMTGGTVATVGYDPAWGLESSLQFASGATSVWTTQADGIHLKAWSIQLPSGTKLDGDRLYAYDASKDALSQAGEWALTHDSRGRLTQASAPDLNSFAATYGYDAFGNNTSEAVSGNVPPQAVPFSFPALPRNQTPALSNGSATGWVYDAAGEATNFGAGVGSTPQTGLVWDGFGRLKQINAPGLTELEGYAPSGMRIRRDDSVAGLSRRYAYTRDGLLLGEYIPGTTGFTWNRDVIYVGSQAIAEVDADGVHELHSDHLGTPRVITRASGGTALVEGRQNFGPYGELFPTMNSGYAPLTGYTGHIQTDPTGLVYMRGRYYTPIWHRFVNSDQGADPSTFNQMTYVSGSPLMAIDPSGMDTETKKPETTVEVLGYTDDIPYWEGGGGDLDSWDPALPGGVGRVGGAGNATQTPKSKVDCIHAINAKYEAITKEVKSKFDAVVNRPASDVWVEGFNNNVISRSEVAAVSAVLGSAAWALGEKAEGNGGRMIVLPGSAGITRWIPAPSTLGRFASVGGRLLGAVGAIGLVGQVWSGTMNVIGYDSYAVPQALNQFNSEMERLRESYQSEISTCQ